MEEQLIARPLEELEIEDCCECNRRATHEVDSREGSGVFTCIKQVCMVPYIFGHHE